MTVRAFLGVACLVACLQPWGTFPAVAVETIPEKLVVLTFDDSAKSHFTIVRPILKKYGFGATFFITEGFDFPTNKQDYMTWDEIAALQVAVPWLMIQTLRGNNAGHTTRDLAPPVPARKLTRRP